MSPEGEVDPKVVSTLSESLNAKLGGIICQRVRQNLDTTYEICSDQGFSVEDVENKVTESNEQASTTLCGSRIIHDALSNLGYKIVCVASANICPMRGGKFNSQ